MPQEALLAFVAEEDEHEDDELEAKGEEKSLGVKIFAYWPVLDLGTAATPRLSPRPNSSSESSGYDEEASDDNITIFSSVEIEPNSIRPRVSFIKWKRKKKRLGVSWFSRRKGRANVERR